MEIKKEGQTFFKGMHRDFSPAFQPEDTYRDATNIELTSAGEQMIVNQIRSSLLVQSKQINAAYSVDNINILSYAVAKAKISGASKDGFVVYTYVDGNNGSANDHGIYFFAQESAFSGGNIYTIYTGDDLNFSATTSVDSFFTEDRENKTVYFTDFSNTLRKIQMDDTIWATYSSADQLNVISDASSAMAMTITGLGNDGSLLAGTYQLAYRLKQTSASPSTYTKWSTFTNPVPIIPLSYSSGTTVNYYGGAVGQQTSRSINYSIALSTGETNSKYDKIEVAVVKNNIGTYLQQLVAYVSEITNTNTGTTTLTGTYTGNEPEFELDIDEITAPDAPVETVKTIVEKDNRLLAGNIKYFDRRIADDEVNIIEARTIRRMVDYEDPLNTTRYRGYFRDEVYRFGITYHDQYGNWSPVKPLNFSNFSASTPKNFSRITGSVATGKIDYNANLITITRGTAWPVGASGYVEGESVSCTLTVGSTSLSFETEIVSVASTTLIIALPGEVFAPYPSFATASGTADLLPLKGNAYNHSSDQFSWKFPKREHIGITSTGSNEFGPYSLLAATGSNETYRCLPQALGLRIDVSGHPEWARGMAVVRMDRDRDILYQSPIVPSSLYLGTPTPGKNLATNNDYTITNGIGELDYLGPKCLKMGAARNMEALSLFSASWNNSGMPSTIEAQETYRLPVYQGISSIPENRMLWKKAFAPAVDYVYNSAGLPLIKTPDLVTMNVDIVDVCGFTLSAITPTTTTSTVTPTGMSISYPTGYVEARVYSCTDHKLHWYPNTYINMRTQSSAGTGGTYINTYRRKIQESFLQANGIQTASFVGYEKAADVLAKLGSIVDPLAFTYYTRTLLNLSSLTTTDLLIPVTKGNSKILMNSPESASSNGASLGDGRSSVNYLIAGTDLTAQQKNSSIDMSDVGTAKLYSTNIEVQRTTAISLNQFLDDPLYLITANYCPLSAGQFGYIPRSLTSTGRVNTFASVAFAQYVNNYNPTGGTNQLRNGLIYGNPLMNVTWLGSVDYGANQFGVPSYPVIPTTINEYSFNICNAPVENVDCAVEFAYSGGTFSKYSSPTTDIHQALYVANLRAGKPDSRYGNPNQIQEYIHTGAYAPVTGTGQRIALDVWGGDCFISKYRYKVNDEYNVPGYYLPTASGVGNLDFDFRGYCESFPTGITQRTFKTGTKTSPEYIEMYTEGEANAFYNSDKNRFPYYNRTTPNAGSVGDYQADAFYNYNFGYSIENFPKKFFSENRLTSVSQNYPARLIYSDVRSADLNQDGFSRFRALNFFDMDEKYGKVTKIALLNDNEPIVGQDDSISLLYVNKSLTTLQDNQTLAVQGGTYISDNTPPKYLTTNYGVELLRCMIPTENGVYALDTKRGVLLNILDGVKITSLSRMEQYFRENFSGTNVPWLEHTIQMSYDRVDKVLYIIGALPANINEFENQEVIKWLSYGVKLDAFMSNLDWDVQGNGHGGKIGNRPLYIFDLNGSTYMLQTHSRNNSHNIIDLHVNEWKGGNSYLSLLTGNHLVSVDANIEYVFNKNLNEPKVLDVVGINSQSLFSQFNITAYNDSANLTPSSTNNQTTGIVSRLGMSSTNIIRDGNSKRLVGAYHTIKLWFSNTSTGINLRSAVNQFRKVFR